jgi:hypothetical protein
VLHRVGAVMPIDGTAASGAQTSKMLSNLSDLRAKFVERIDMLAFYCDQCGLWSVSRVEAH